MATVYLSNCGCIRSQQEPDPASFPINQPDGTGDWGEYDAAYRRWHHDWMAECEEHERQTGHRT